METIKQIIENKMPIEGGIILKILKEVSDNGDIMIIKSDGLRNSLTYSIIISSHENKFIPIRFDSDEFESGIIKALKEYKNIFD